MTTQEIQETKEKILKALEEDSINSIEEARKFIEEKENGELCEVNVKWEICFSDGGEIFKFYSDEELIDWCREQRNNYFSE